MQILKSSISLIAGFSALVSVSLAENLRPSLVLTADGVKKIRAEKTYAPLFDDAFQTAKKRVAASIKEGVVMPVPKDPGGGYTHERHKENYKVIHDAGILFQITGEKKYLDHATEMLLSYAEIYNDLPLHPAQKKQSPGKLFWQNLNESVWLVYTIQGFDAIADALKPDDRARIETDLLRPVAEFLSTGSPETFRKIHNHGTWAAAAVGMTGYALGDQALVDRAIMGLDGDGSSGFLKQLDLLFSPDGYYTEGPYYQRYALMPFVLFGQSIDNNEPEREIFNYRDEVLLKAIDSTIQQSYAGKFFPINDAIKEKGLDTQELVYGVAAAYDRTSRLDLLSIAGYQGTTVLTGAGLDVARGVDDGKTKPFDFQTMLLRDGPDGDQGALSVFRMGQGELAQTIVAKNTSHGMGHGHFDKLSLIFYDEGDEILIDYGAARFLNVPTKDGGRYLPENNSWAKQTIAHNTLVVNEASQFEGNWHQSQKYWPETKYFSADPTVNIVSADLENAYPGTKISRTVLQIKASIFSAPIMVDVLAGVAENKASFDLPFYFTGQLVDFDGEMKAQSKSRTPLGSANGYQHLWVEAFGKPAKNPAQLTWLNNQRFYTLMSALPKNSTPVFVRTGANDPDFNLRSQQGVVFRVPKSKAATFVSVLEPHGIYDPAAEFTNGSASQIKDLSYLESEGKLLIEIEAITGEKIHIGISNDADPDKEHRIKFGKEIYSWSGFYKIFGG